MLEERARLRGIAEAYRLLSLFTPPAAARRRRPVPTLPTTTVRFFLRCVSRT